MEKLRAFHQTRNGYVAFAVLDIVLLYIVVSSALDTANMWTYLVATILIGGVIFNIVNAIKLQFKK